MRTARYIAKISFFRRISTAEIKRAIIERYPKDLITEIHIKTGQQFTGSNVTVGSPVQGCACLYPIHNLDHLPEDEKKYLENLGQNYAARIVTYEAKTDGTGIVGPSPSGATVPVIYCSHEMLKMLPKEPLVFPENNRSENSTRPTPP